MRVWGCPWERAWGVGYVEVHGSSGDPQLALAPIPMPANSPALSFPFCFPDEFATQEYRAPCTTGRVWRALLFFSFLHLPHYARGFPFSAYVCLTVILNEIFPMHMHRFWMQNCEHKRHSGVVSLKTDSPCILTVRFSWLD